MSDEEKIASEEQMKVKTPPGQGWWPVIALQTAYGAITKKPTAVLVVCWSQLLSDGTVMAWWIYL